MYCNRCGTPVHVGYRFCAACGAPLVLPRVRAGAPPPGPDAAPAVASPPPDATTPCPQPSVTPVSLTGLRSYQRAIALTLVLYACGYLPGAIANSGYWWAVRRDEAATGACPSGGTAIAALFALGVCVPLGGTLAILALRLLGLLFSSTTGG